MQPHPDFVQVSWPRQFALGDWTLAPLTPDHVDEDFEAVLATAHLFGDFFGSWPEGLTRDENLIDLAWHDREFISRRSFSWILRDGASTYTGCFYVYPNIGERGAAEAALWLCDIPNRAAVARTVKSALAGWLAQNLPPGIALTWTTSPELA
ncbi:hypothetical protein So717_35700 [Roseobacter cerasinus]|uniref:GNAT family N-acetyltransferase n=1 Tax=Roseobacter cerasinus TaxID=2602289 RepID=A0A640VVD0_9RHOB|nr:hypothetical protein [Roseobacter cerasinus]GFE51817.1 hypothetical protein So717_35700 [Roseobacter cerasinus]